MEEREGGGLETIYTVLLESPGDFPKFPPNTPQGKSRFFLNGRSAWGLSRTRKQMCGACRACLGLQWTKTVLGNSVWKVVKTEAKKMAKRIAKL